MNWKVLFSNYGQGMPYAPQRKQWVATAIGVGAGLLSSWLGGRSASKAARKANQMIANQKAKNDAWYNRRYNEDYADTAAGQNIIRQAKEYAKQNWKKAQGAAKVGGATDESAAMAKEAGNKVVASTLSNIAAQDTHRKDNVDRIHQNIDNQLTQQQIGVEQNRAQQITNAAQNASNAMMTAGLAVDGAFDKKDALEAVTGTPVSKATTVGGGSSKGNRMG